MSVWIVSCICWAIENDRKKVIAFRIFFLIVILILIIGFIIYRHNNSNKENDNKLLNEVSSAVSPKEDTIFKQSA